jgi:hypothetical protein
MSDTLVALSTIDTATGHQDRAPIPPTSPLTSRPDRAQRSGQTGSIGALPQQYRPRMADQILTPGHD